MSRWRTWPMSPCRSFLRVTTVQLLLNWWLREAWLLWIRLTDELWLVIPNWWNSTWMVTRWPVYQPGTSLWFHCSRCCLCLGTKSAGKWSHQCCCSINKCVWLLLLQKVQLMVLLLQPGPTVFLWPEVTNRAGPVQQPADQCPYTAVHTAQ